MSVRISQSDGSEWIGSLVWTAAGAVAVFLVYFFWGIVSEIARIYKEHGFDGSETARRLQFTLFVFLAVVMVCGLLLLNPELTPLAWYFAAWSFLIFVAVVEFLGLQADRAGRERLIENEAGLLETDEARYEDNPFMNWMEEGLVVGQEVPDGAL